jgi:hypothetical protein
MCLYMLCLNLNDRAVVVTDRSFLPDNGNQLEVKGRSKSRYDTNICLTLSLVSKDSQHVAHRWRSVLGFITSSCLCRHRRRNERRFMSRGVFDQVQESNHSQLLSFRRVLSSYPDWEPVSDSDLLWFFLHSYMKVKGLYVAMNNKSFMSVCERIVTQNCH